jgi:glycosyltransferase involved in cell wall biosynthesis
MTATLRLVLDTEAEPDIASAAIQLGRALVRTAPDGCEVAAIVPAGAEVERAVPGLADIRRLTFGRRELLAAWQLGVTAGIGGGLIHAPSLLAPLTRHDRIHDNDQTVVTLWDLDMWERPDRLPRAVVAWQKAMFKRAQKHADAIVVPTHAMAERLAEHSKLGGRIRVVSGAGPAGFAVPTDAVGRRRTLGIPEGTIVVAGADGAELAFAALAAANVALPIVVLDAGEGDEPAIADHAAAAGIPESHLHVRGALDDADRAALLDGALALVAPSLRTAFPWRVVDALALGVPVVAVASDVHRDVIADGGTLADADAGALGDALVEFLGSSSAIERMSVLSADRGRAFSWRDAAERVWQLHAEL